jgi:hypothetical protein
MITTIALLAGFLFIFLLIKMKNNKPKLITKVNFKTQKGKTYTGVLRQGKSGRTRGDWDFYDNNDDLITNLIILDYLFDVINFDSEWEEMDYAIDDSFIDANISNTEVVQDVVYSEVAEEVSVETVIEEVPMSTTSEPVEETVVEDTVSEPVYVPDPAPVAEVYETEIESKPYDSGSYDSGSYDSGSYDSGSSDSGGSWD